MIKDPRVYERPDNPATTILAADFHNHGRQRRLLAHGFSEKALREQESIINKYIDLLISRLHQRCSDPVDMTEWYNWTTFDIIGDLSFGEPFGCLQDAAYHQWVALIFKFVKGGAVFQACAYYPTIKKLLRKMIPKSVRAIRDAHRAVTHDKVSRRVQASASRPDFFGAILDKKDDLVRVVALFLAYLTPASD